MGKDSGSGVGATGSRDDSMSLLKQPGQRFLRNRLLKRLEVPTATLEADNSPGRRLGGIDGNYRVITLFSLW